MTKSEIQHITDTTTDPENEPELVFTGAIFEGSGNRCDHVVAKPEHWDNVRHLVGNLFYAYDNKAPYDGLVYIGKFV
jgi:hypothetical protein